jgi:hypothetical protein
MTFQSMRFRYTKHQVARGALPDAQDRQKICLIKNTSRLMPTYQVRLLTYFASESKRKLIIYVPQHCKLHPTLERFLVEFERTVYIERTK